MECNFLYRNEAIKRIRKACVTPLILAKIHTNILRYKQAIKARNAESLNAFISCRNKLSNYCEMLGPDVFNMIAALQADTRI